MSTTKTKHGRKYSQNKKCNVPLTMPLTAMLTALHTLTFQCNDSWKCRKNLQGVNHYWKVGNTENHAENIHYHWGPLKNIAIHCNIENHWKLNDFENIVVSRFFNDFQYLKKIQCFSLPFNIFQWSSVVVNIVSVSTFFNGD